MVDTIKKSLSAYILARVTDAFFDWERLGDRGANVEVIHRDTLATMYRVHLEGEAPRYFEVRIKEVM
jgi:hypothetical protein